MVEITPKWSKKTLWEISRGLPQKVQHPENRSSRKIKEDKQEKIINSEKYPRTKGHNHQTERTLWKPYFVDENRTLMTHHYGISKH